MTTRDTSYKHKDISSLKLLSNVNAILFTTNFTDIFSLYL